jgi:hypothetical protein
MLSAPGSSSFQAFLGPAMAEHNLRIEREALSELLPWRGFFRCRWITVPDNEAALYGSERYSYLTTWELAGRAWHRRDRSGEVGIGLDHHPSDSEHLASRLLKEMVMRPPS